ncbi:MAG TPA: thioredoxin domain-containing protein [Longimicrobium sp.]|jgi:protein-disulfide isomerase|uniref:DsbA family protein n=1 Tax=Longimicrobium sp. TaxID=2029185 RepID=UPI002ED85CA2
MSNVGTAIMVLCAVTVTSLVIRRELFTPAAASAVVNAETRTIADWRSYVEGHRIGPQDASVTIVEFSDFECQFCRAAASRLRALQEKYPRDVALVYRHYPLPYHKNAVPAAKASVCAARQGRFREYHDALFAQQDSLGAVPWARLATEAAVPDEAAFEACFRSSGPDSEIERDREAGSRLGVQGTPAILVNERLVFGAPPGTLEEFVESAVRAAARK